MDSESLTVEEALAIVEAVLAPNRLNAAQELVFCRCWLGQTYQAIAQSSGYDADYVRVVGSRLWQSLSEVLGEKVTKNNLHAVLRQIVATQVRQGAQPSSTITPNQGSLLEFPGSPLPLNSPFYIERPPIEERAYEEILKPGAIVRIKAPEKWGKTSLILRILAHAAARGCRTVRLNLQQADSDALVSLERFLRWFCANLAYELQLEPKLNDYWDVDLGSKVSCTTYLQGYVLAQLKSPLVIALDEVERLFEYPAIARDFLPMLRVWHEEANNLAIWGQLRLIVVYSTEVYIPLNLNQSPFNVGLPIQLPKFNLEQTQDLALRHGLELSDVPDLARLREMVDGHPYLIHLAFYRLCRGEVTLEQFLKEAPTQTGIYSDRLRRYLSALQDHPELSAAFKKVITADRAVQLEAIPTYKLESMGLIELEGDRATPSCDLYRLYFRDRLDRF
jgi:AAA-like domain